MFRVHGSDPLGALTLAGLDQEAGFYFSAGLSQALALVAVPLETPAGFHWLTLRRGGSSQRLRLQVAPDDYPRKRIKVAGLTRILTSSEHADENQRIRAALNASVGPPLWRGKFRAPVPGPVTSPFGSRRFYNKGKAAWRHKGVDLRAALGSPVGASNRGTVILAKKNTTTYGGAVIVDHGGGLVSAYFHLGPILVRQGESVVKGQILGEVGTGGISTGPHLHWQLSLRGFAVHPLQWVEAP